MTYHIDAESGELVRDAEPRKYNAAGLMEALGVSRDTLLGWVYEGMPCALIGRPRALNFTADALAVDDFLRRRHSEHAGKLSI